MSTIIVITPPPTKPKVSIPTVESLKDDAQCKIRVEVGDRGTLSDRLRAAADLLDGAS